MTSAVETDAKVDSVPVCAVCADVSDGLHFSVLSCRACAAFFRRTVSLKLTYKCRNESNCKIEKTARNMCRHCRFQKCLNVGMLTSAVQQTRDGIGKRGITQRSVSELQDLRFSTTEIPSSSTGNQTEGWSEVQKHTPLLLNRTKSLGS
ncbi:hypothetical protein AB6A40_010179 [Gnathostoma spinigerum]|uniref:Nuclear receptor domain-containing protein n=1 Tax=Gnathostoma spinigerum TaxID=75299 RepID=A0ABD6EVE2_9BILA